MSSTEISDLLGKLTISSDESHSKPDRQTIQSLYHKYADVLRSLPRSQLPAEKKMTKEENKLMLRILKFHPSAEKKIGCGVEYFFVRRLITEQGK